MIQRVFGKSESPLDIFSAEKTYVDMPMQLTGTDL